MRKKRIRQAILIALALVLAVIIAFPIYLLVISALKQPEDIFGMNIFRRFRP